jgi:hypothetical protein
MAKCLNYIKKLPFSNKKDIDYYEKLIGMCVCERCKKTTITNLNGYK